MQVALERLELPAGRCMMTGDRLETDIFMGQQAGMYTSVVLTGAAKREDVARMSSPPSFVIENIGDIPPLVS
jgi:ribonucleotide monophosphatase NagD (HAD superfamily)